MQIAAAGLLHEAPSLVWLQFDVTITEKMQEHEGDSQYLESPAHPPTRINSQKAAEDKPREDDTREQTLSIK